MALKTYRRRSDAMPDACYSAVNRNYRDGQGFLVADDAASAEDEAASGARAGVAVGAGAGTAVVAADATGRDAAGRAAVATGFFFFAIGFFDVVTACRLT